MERIRILFAAGMAVATVTAVAAPPPTRLPAYVAAAAADPSRAAQAGDDARRHGPEIVAFSGLRPGGRVLDLIPGAAYWTRLFAKTVGPAGHVYGIWPKPYADEAGKNIVDYRALGATPAYANVSGDVQPATVLSVPEKVDLVFTAQNYHDYPDKFMGSLDPSVLNKAAYAALKPGGVYLIIDHAARAGSGMRDTDTLHRIDPAIVRKQVTAAGFRFLGESRLLANPGDDHTKAVFDKSIRGRTDQFIYKFRKPG
ncbi:MAG: methyltransferase [Sphingomonas sp.]